MLMVSSSSTSSSPALKQDDNLFRLAPDDFNQAAAITAMLRSYGDGIDAVVIIQRRGIHTSISRGRG